MLHLTLSAELNVSADSLNLLQPDHQIRDL